MRETLLLILSYLIVVSTSSSCFITNCPPGGKRSAPPGGKGSGTTSLRSRQCEQCGPPDMGGRCYGPQICCSPEFGCLMGTMETRSCLEENHHSTLCHNPGDPCGGFDESNLINGQCGASGFCCSSETCTLDSNCQVGPVLGLLKTIKVNHGEETKLNGKSQPFQKIQENSDQIFPNPMDRLFYGRVNEHKGIPIEKSLEIPTSDIRPQLVPLFGSMPRQFNENNNILLNANDY